MSAVLPASSDRSPGRASQWRQTLSRRWLALAPRERRVVRIAAVLLVAALLWWLLLAPALATLRMARVQQPVLEAQLLQMGALQQQARELQAAPKIDYDQALRAVEAATKQRFGNTAQFAVLGERATVTLRGATADALAAWLAQVRIDARALPGEVRLVRSPVAGIPTNPGWDGTVVLTLPVR